MIVTATLTSSFDEHMASVLGMRSFASEVQSNYRTDARMNHTYTLALNQFVANTQIRNLEFSTRNNYYNALNRDVIADLGRDSLRIAAPRLIALAQEEHRAAVATLLHWIFIHNEFGPALVHFIPLALLETYRIVKIKPS